MIADALTDFWGYSAPILPVAKAQYQRLFLIG